LLLLFAPLLVDTDVTRERDELSMAGDLHCFCRWYPSLNHPRNSCMPTIMETEVLNPRFLQTDRNAFLTVSLISIVIPKVIIQENNVDEYTKNLN